MGGCIASAFALWGLAIGGQFESWPLRANVFALGLANGAFAVAAIGSMMSLASEGKSNREGVRMGLWGAAQAIAFGLGGFLGTVGVDLVRFLTESIPASYGVVFAAEGLLFFVSAGLALHVGAARARKDHARITVAGDGYLAGVGGP